jgi:hypothetical protein
MWCALWPSVLLPFPVISRSITSRLPPQCAFSDSPSGSVGPTSLPISRSVRSMLKPSSIAPTVDASLMASRNFQIPVPNTAPSSYGPPAVSFCTKGRYGCLQRRAASRINQYAGSTTRAKRRTSKATFLAKYSFRTRKASV